MTVTLTNNQFEQMRKMQKTHNEYKQKLEAIKTVIKEMDSEIEDEITSHFYKRKLKKILQSSTPTIQSSSSKETKQ